MWGVGRPMAVQVRVTWSASLTVMVSLPLVVVKAWISGISADNVYRFFPINEHSWLEGNIVNVHQSLTPLLKISQQENQTNTFFVTPMTSTIFNHFQ